MNSGRQDTGCSRQFQEGAGGRSGAEKSIQALMEAIDAFIPLPPREVDKPFLMCIEDVFQH